MAREARGGKEAVVAVIGDGALGNGLAYEALNHIGDYQKPLIIILNDNRMSISANVGALHNSLERIRLHRGYRSAKSRTKAALRRIPVVGNAMVHGVEQVKEDLKRLYLRDGALFEEMGITYYGPVNGHDLGELDAFLPGGKGDREAGAAACRYRKGAWVPIFAGMTPMVSGTGWGPLMPKAGGGRWPAVPPRERPSVKR